MSLKIIYFSYFCSKKDLIYQQVLKNNGIASDLLSDYSVKLTESRCVFSPIICLWPECGDLIDSKKNKKKHILKHTNSSSVLYCLWPKCNKSFKAPVNLQQHMEIHYLHSPFKCNVSLTV